MIPWRCSHCQRTGNTRPDVAVLFHVCTAPRTTRPPRRPLAEVREQWARNLIGEAIADALDEESLLRRVDPDPTTGDSE